MISRKLIGALLGVSLLVATGAEAATSPAPATTAAVTTQAGSPAQGVAKHTAPAKRVAVVTRKHHRAHVTHNMTKRTKSAKLYGGKKIVAAHLAKKALRKHV